MQLLGLENDAPRLISTAGRWTSLRADEDGHGLTPDGRSVVVTEASAAGDGDIALLALDGTEDRTIVSAPTNDTDPAVSPDGLSVVFLRTTTGDVFIRHGDVDLVVVGIDGTGERTIARSACGCAAVWAPDGSRVATWTNDLQQLRVDGEGAPVHVPTPGNVGAMSWQTSTAQ